MFKRKKKSKDLTEPTPTPQGTIKTFDEGWKWLKKNGWKFYAHDQGLLKTVTDVYICAERGNGYSITVKAEGSTPLDAMQILLAKIEDNELF